MYFYQVILVLLCVPTYSILNLYSFRYLEFQQNSCIRCFYERETMNTQQKKVAVVTGSNKGIGFAIVQGLCRDFSGDVYLTARNETLGLAAVKLLNNIGLYPKFYKLDITDECSIVKLKDHLVKEYGGLDILVNNAGISREDDLKDLPFAIETMRVNYFSTKKTCEILFPILRPHARVVNLSSRFGRLYSIPSETLREKLGSKTLTVKELDELMTHYVELIERNETLALSNWGDFAYSVSKVGVCVLTRIHQREFLNDAREDIIVNSVHPGWVDTDMTRPLGRKGQCPIEQGAIAPLYAALLPANVIEPKGAFIWENKDIIDWAAPFDKNSLLNDDVDE